MNENHVCVAAGNPSGSGGGGGTTSGGSISQGVFNQYPPVFTQPLPNITFTPGFRNQYNFPDTYDEEGDKVSIDIKFSGKKPTFMKFNGKSELSGNPT